MVGTSTGALTLPPAGTVSRAAGRWRTVLLAWLALAALATVLAGTRPADLAELERGLASGEVTEVHVVGALRAGEVGHSRAEVWWHDGLQPRYTTVQHVRDDADSQHFPGSSAPVVRTDLAAQLTGWTPSGELQVTAQDYWTGWRGEIYGWQVPVWAAAVGSAWALAAFATLLLGPEPRRATRWAWFWLCWSSGGLALAVYLFAGLPRAGAALQPEGRRLTGGWALLLAFLVVGPVVGARA